jgi:quercetin dioxygenase-like cupin family protein
MRLFHFGPTTGRPLEQFGSQAALVARLARGRGETQLRLFYLEAGGLVGHHPATVPQLLCVIQGAGEVCGQAGEWRAIGAGQAAFWEAGEWHTTRTGQGLTALVVEGEALEPWAPELG